MCSKTIDCKGLQGSGYYHSSEALAAAQTELQFPRTALKTGCPSCCVAQTPAVPQKASFPTRGQHAAPGRHQKAGQLQEDAAATPLVLADS